MDLIVWLAKNSYLSSSATEEGTEFRQRKGRVLTRNSGRKESVCMHLSVHTCADLAYKHTFTLHEFCPFLRS